MRLALCLLPALVGACVSPGPAYVPTQTKVEPIEGWPITREQNYAVRQMLRRFEQGCQGEPDAQRFNFCYAQMVSAARDRGQLEGFQVSTLATSNNMPMRTR